MTTVGLAYMRELSRTDKKLRALSLAILGRGTGENVLVKKPAVKMVEKAHRERDRYAIKSK